MRLSNAETDRLEKLGEVLMQLSALPRPLEAKTIRKLAFRFGRRVITDALVVDMGRRDAKIDSELWTAAGSAPTHSPFTGAMVIKRGVPAGPIIGEIIRHADAAWEASDFSSDPKLLQNLLSEAIARYSDKVVTAPTAIE
jgi:poly(A) polymerase